MEKSNKFGSEITVRISLTFQDAPDVHTLLAMTPVRERGKLVRLALQQYINATDHPSGNVDAQIEAISQWLRNRTSAYAADIAPNTVHSQTQEKPSNLNRNGPSGVALPKEVSKEHLGVEYGDGDRQQSSVTTTTKKIESPSLRRWMID
jgi:hypothetical protein